jgi:uncharacterized membrane protein YbhN (UPF0104 family)
MATRTTTRRRKVPRTKLRRLWTPAKVVFAAACVAFVVRRVDLAGIPGDVAQLGPGTWGLLAALVPLHVLSLAFRWRSALAELDDPVPLRPVVGDLMVGVTYNSLLPSTVGGDLVRAYRCATRVSRESSALASIALERSVGLVCLAAVPLVGLLVGLGEAPPVLLLLSLGASLAFALVLAGLHLPFALGGRVASRFAPRVASLMIETAGALRRVGPAGRGRIAGWSLAYQALVALSFFVVASALSEPQALRGVLVGVPIALVISTVPITIGGFGIREGAFVAVLGRLGFSPGGALVMSLFWAVEWMLIGVAGAMVMATTRMRPFSWSTGAHDR